MEVLFAEKKWIYPADLSNLSSQWFVDERGDAMDEMRDERGAHVKKETCSTSQGTTRARTGSSNTSCQTHPPDSRRRASHDSTSQSRRLRTAF